MTPRQIAYSAYLLSGHWKELRQTVLARDGFRCVRCPAKKHLQAHHRIYRNRFEDSQPEDLITLCRHCHEIEHGIGLKKQSRTKHRKKRLKLSIGEIQTILDQCESTVQRRGRISHGLRRKLRYIRELNGMEFYSDRAAQILATWFDAHKPLKQPKGPKPGLHKFNQSADDPEKCVCGLYRGAHSFKFNQTPVQSHPGRRAGWIGGGIVLLVNRDEVFASSLASLTDTIAGFFGIGRFPINDA